MKHKNPFLSHQELHQKILENIGDLISVVDLKARFLYISPSHKKILGYEEKDLLGKSGLEYFHPSDVSQIKRKMVACILQRKTVSSKARFRHKDGHWLTLEGIGTPLLNKVGIPNMILVASRDITKWVEMEEKVRHLALHDSLTRLPNRLLFEDRVEQALRSAKRHAHQVALLFVDIDNFKEVNDTWGHLAGDQLLRQIAERLILCLREEDTAARFGGDEFTVLIPNASSLSTGVKVAEKILRKLSRPYRVHRHRILVTASIGIAFYPENATTQKSLLKRADAAMYIAKKEHNTYVISKETAHA